MIITILLGSQAIEKMVKKVKVTKKPLKAGTVPMKEMSWVFNMLGWKEPPSKKEVQIQMRKVYADLNKKKNKLT